MELNLKKKRINQNGQSSLGNSKLIVKISQNLTNYFEHCVLVEIFI